MRNAGDNLVLETQKLNVVGTRSVSVHHKINRMQWPGRFNKMLKRKHGRQIIRAWRCAFFDLYAEHIIVRRLDGWNFGHVNISTRESWAREMGSFGKSRTGAFRFRNEASHYLAHEAP